MDKLILGRIMTRYLAFPLILILAVTLLSALTGCLPGKSVEEIKRVCIFPTDIENGGRLSVFLNLARPDGPHVSVQVSSVEVLVGAQWFPLLDAPPLALDSRKIGQGQVFIGSRELAAGIVSRLRIKVDSVNSIENGGATAPLVVGDSLNEIPLSEHMALTVGASKTINLHWDVDASLVPGMFLKFSATGVPARKSNLVTANLAYAACPDIDTVYVIRTDKNWVVGSFGVAGKPAYLFIDKQQNKMFVMGLETNVLKIFDLASNDLLDEIRLPMTKHPVSMAVRPDYDKAYVLDEQGYLTRIDLVNGTIEERLRVGQQPSYVIYLEKQDRLAVSSTFDRTVYIVNPKNMRIEEPIRVSGTPQGLLVFDDLLYISEADSNTVSVFDLDFRRMQTRIATGTAPYRLVAVDNIIYVSNRSDGSLSLLRGSSRSPTVSKVLFVGENVQEMAVSELQRYLYVGNGKCDGSLAVIDLTRHHEVGRIELGAFPKGVVFFQ